MLQNLFFGKSGRFFVRNLLQYETFSPIAFSADVDLERIVSGPIAECSVLQDVLPGVAFCSLREGMTHCVAVQRAACVHARRQGCQMVKFDPFLTLDCARLEGAIQGKEGIKFYHLATLPSCMHTTHAAQLRNASFLP